MSRAGWGHIAGLALALLIAFAIVGASVAWGSTAPISDYATSLVGAPTPVHCITMPPELRKTGTLGFVLETQNDDGTTTMGPDIFLDHRVCFALSLAIAGTPGDPYTLATSLETLTHEAYHVILNSGNESTVACNDILHIDRTIRLFGLAGDLRRMHELAWASYWDAPDSYLQDPVCRAHPHEGLVGIGPVKAPKAHILPRPRGGRAKILA